MIRLALRKASIGSAAAIVLSAAAHAAPLPGIKASPDNAVPECVTPGRLTAFLENRNKKLDPRFRAIAAEYMRHGQDLGLRWDIAFFQMQLETGNLKFGGDVKPDQNNFAGLGASGGGAPGESFPDISTGVLAHLQHLALYAGQEVENPVAQRTREIRDSGVVKSFYKGEGAKTFADLAKLWAAGSPGYTKNIVSIAGDFMKGPCLNPDPAGDAETVARAPQAEDAKPQASAEPPVEPFPEPSTAPVNDAVASRDASGPEDAAGPELGAPDGKAADIKAADIKSADAGAPPQKPATSAKADPEPPAAKAEKAEAPKPPQDTAQAKPAEEQVAAAIAPKQGADAPAGAPCRVWTASYGGSKAIIIKATLDKTINYTVLDVNEGKEKREAEAYIAAYAKGGEAVGEFPSQTQALDKAFELCPEG